MAEDFLSKTRKNNGAAAWPWALRTPIPSRTKQRLYRKEEVGIWKPERDGKG